MSHLPGSALATTASGALHSLWLSRLTAERLSQLPAHPELNTLTIEHAASLEVDSLDGWTNLRRPSGWEPAPRSDRCSPLSGGLRR